LWVPTQFPRLWGHWGWKGGRLGAGPSGTLFCVQVCQERRAAQWRHVLIDICEFHIAG
jgi:hypothetical protein